MQDYFRDELNLEEEDYQAYLTSVDELTEGRQRIYDYFRAMSQEEGIPHLSSFEEQKALLDLKERTMDRLSRRLGEQNFQKLLIREREIKREWLTRDGHYVSFGIND